LITVCGVSEFAFLVFFYYSTIYVQAETDGLLEVNIHIDSLETMGTQTYFEEIKQLYYRVSVCNF